ncbi:acyl-CoA thioesterase II [uncultured Sphingomonas sp.]|jgi:acyl-CoA thioesterase-2|uniref:acyl-CoA thioesterase n=1 Tax=uncultured Sphingomonas sp. TaxID=158754 RepID=UPI002607F43E|nr:acyl-CoA thioesterase II [uncultured Sphingomonas sp.]
MDSEAAPTPETLVAQLRALLDIEAIDTDLYRGPRKPGGRGRVFGGQVIAQALVAAMRSVGEGRTAHSLHAYFMRPGDETLPIVYRVVRDFEGRSFATRRVIAMQRGEPILNMAASFQRPEEGLAHQVAMPDVPAPESLTPDRDLLERDRAGIPDELIHFLLQPRPIEIRSVDPRSLLHPEKRPPYSAGWFRVVAPLGDDPDLHRAVLAYASDMIMLGTSMLPHGVSVVKDKMQNASLDHAVWLHEPFRFDDWLLFTTDSPWSGHARGFNRGQIFSRDGRLVASVAQEGLIRHRPG